MKALSMLAAMLLLSGLGLSAAAQDDGGDPDPGGMRGMMQGRHGLGEIGGMMQGRRDMDITSMYRGANFYLRFRSELGLDDSQVQKIKAIRLEKVKQVSQLRSKLAVSRLEMQDILDSDNVDLAKVQAKVVEISGLQSELKFAAIKSSVEATRILTDDQRTKAQEMGHMRRPGGRMQGNN